MGSPQKGGRCQGARGGLGLEGQPSLSLELEYRAGDRSPAVGWASERGYGDSQAWGCPGLPPKPFRPSAEGIHARPCHCQWQDSAIEGGPSVLLSKGTDSHLFSAPQYRPIHPSSHCLSPSPFSSVHANLKFPALTTPL